MGLGALNPDDSRYSPPYGAHQILFDAVDEVVGPNFRRGPNGEQAEKRRDDYLLGTALFLDIPDDEGPKTGVYFAASMIAEAPNRDVQTQTAIVNNYTSIVPSGSVEESDEYESEIGIIAEAFNAIEKEAEDRIAGSETTESEIVAETLDGVRSGKSFFARWGNARQAIKEDVRNHGKGKFDL
jgi:hypothetical protein